MTTEFQIPADGPDIGPGARQLARGWLWLGIAALALAGLLAILLGLSRTPGIQNVFPLRDFFKAALVVHVDLSVLIWFVAFAGVLWSHAGGERLAMPARAGLLAASLGTAMLVTAPFLPDTQPLLNNYIPVLQQPLFFAGLAMVGLGMALMLVRTLIVLWPWKADVLQSGLFAAALAGTLALAGFMLSWLTPIPFEGQMHYEALFWGGGHTLQFQHTLLMVVAWLWLARECGASPALAPKWLVRFFLLAALPLLAVPLLHATWPAGSAQHVAAFAHLMRYGHPLMLPLILIIALMLPQVWRVKSPAAMSLLASFALFAAGGVLAYMITGVNVIIPAHYHGSIVGVTLAFMGMTYVLLPRLGFAEPSPGWARLQPWVYGIGQLIHIIGLAWSGGYGVQRKVAGADQVLTSLPQKIGMGMMGLGMGIAVIGGAIFVIICLAAMLRRR